MAVAFAVVAISLAIPLYAYLIYPALLWVWSRFRAAPRVPPDPANWPEITITLPVHNEEARIARTLDTLLALDYPPDRRHIVVVSDASTDGTDEIVRRMARRGVTLVRLPRRAGKTAAENAAVSHVRGDIVVSTDASVRVHRDAVRALVRAFGDPSVGVASGRDVSVSQAGDGASRGEGVYVTYEMWVRRLETRVGGIVGASGCLYAMRAELYRELLPEALSRDFAAALVAREHGYRAVAVDEAICVVPRTTSLRAEFRRKARTMTRGLETLFFKRRLMNPLVYGAFAWKLFSHKLARWLVPWAIVAGGAAALWLLLGTPAGAWVVGGATAVLAAAALGWWGAERGRVPVAIALLSYAAAATVAGVQAWIRAVRGELNPIWAPTRRPLDPA